MIQSLLLFEVEQPIGFFYIGKIETDVLLSIASVNRRSSGTDSQGIQRQLDREKAKAITAYCSDPDATFPTPIILSINSSDILTFESFGKYYELTFDDTIINAEILDGQHRVEGIRNDPRNIKELVLVIMLDLTNQEKAYVFSTINSNQKKVDRSLIYDLFALSTNRSPYKTCHEIARIMNSTESSPFYRRLKMLGKKEYEGQTLSQGFFVDAIMPLLSNKPDDDTTRLKMGKSLDLGEDNSIIFRKYFVYEKDEIIIKILMNYFLAIKKVFPEEWSNDKEYILSKTTGFGAFIKALPSIFVIGIERKTLDQKFFTEMILNVKTSLAEKKLTLTSACFGSGDQKQKDLKDIIIKALPKKGPESE